MPMQDFKPGDKVRCKDGCSFFDSKKIYIVSRTEDRFIYLTEKPYHGWFKSRFELVESSKFESISDPDIDIQWMPEDKVFIIDGINRKRNSIPCSSIKYFYVRILS